MAASQNTTVVVLRADVRFGPDTFGRKQEQPTKHELSWKGSAGILTSWLMKQTSRRPQEEREQRSE
jgi:hypothetical protein